MTCKHEWIKHSNNELLEMLHFSPPRPAPRREPGRTTGPASHSGDYRLELPNGIRIQLSGPEGLELIADVIAQTADRDVSH